MIAALLDTNICIYLEAQSTWSSGTLLEISSRGYRHLNVSVAELEYGVKKKRRA